MAKVVVLGGGYAGMRAIKVLIDKAPKDTQLVLISNTRVHTEKTNIHEVAAGTTTPKEISFDVAEVAKPQRVKFIQDTVTGIDLANKEVKLQESDEPVDYDYVIIALGFRSETFGIKGAQENSLPLTTLDEAAAVAEHIENQIKHYQDSQDPNDLKVVVCGAGFTGIELLGELIHSVKKWSQKYNTPNVELYCVEVATSILPMFDHGLADFAVDYLKRNGVQFVLGAKISGVEPGKVVYEKDDETQEVTANSIVWTVGVSGSHVMDDPAFSSKRGRVITKDDLSLNDEHPEVFVVGDVAAIMNPANNRPWPTTAQVALKSAAHAAANVANLVSGGSATPFEFHSLGTVASLGRTQAIGEVAMGSKQVKLKGYPASALKKVIVDRSLFYDNGVSGILKHGRFDVWH